MSLPRNYLLSPALPSLVVPSDLQPSIVNISRSFFGQTHKAFNLGDHFILSASLYFLARYGIDVLPLSSWDKNPLSRLELTPDISRESVFVFLATANAGINTARLLYQSVDSSESNALMPIVFGVGQKEGQIPRLSSEDKFVYRYISNTSKLCMWRTVESAKTANSVLSDSGIEGIKHVVSGCPVPAYFRDLADSGVLPKLVECNADNHSFLITLTLRRPHIVSEINKFKAIVPILNSCFNRPRIALSFHQYSSLFLMRSTDAKLILSLLDFCLSHGIDVLCPKSTPEAILAYSSYSCHLGSRLHCHLAYLGMRRPSVLWSIDTRSKEFADDLCFQLFDFSSFLFGASLADAFLTSFKSNLSIAYDRIDYYKDVLTTNIQIVAEMHG